MSAVCPMCGSDKVTYKGTLFYCPDCFYKEYDECKEDFYDYPDNDGDDE